MHVEKDGAMLIRPRLFEWLRRYQLPLVVVLVFLFVSVKFLEASWLLAEFLLLVLLFLLLWKLPQWQVADIKEAKDRIDLESKTRQTMAQILGGAALLVGLYFTSQTLHTTQQGQITDRFTKAIDQLGQDKLAVRLGGIYALERIARDSEYDRGLVIEVLTSFVREQTQGRFDTSRSLFSVLLLRDDQEVSIPPADIQAILTVLGRRTYGKEGNQPLDLSRSQLRHPDTRL